MLLRSIIFLITFTQIFAGEGWRKPGCHKMGHTREINIPDCVAFKITTNACRGYCESWSLPSIMLGFKRHPVTSLGQCCNIMESEDAEHNFYYYPPAECASVCPIDNCILVLPTRVKVQCIDGERNLTFKSAVSCACYHCQKE